MKSYINFQTENELFEAHVSGPREFEAWSAKHLRTRGHKLFVVLPGKDAREVFITSSITDIDLFFEYVNMHNKIFIQEFEYGDYKEVFGYLSDLFEVSELPEMPKPLAN